MAQLRRTGSGTSAIAAKSAAGGLPDSILSTMSALANLPGGGVILLGLDESRNFAAVHLADPAKLMAGLASQARGAFQPPIMMRVEAVEFEGERVIVTEIDETPATAKPCRLKRGGATPGHICLPAILGWRLSAFGAQIQGFYAGRVSRSLIFPQYPERASATSIRSCSPASSSRYATAINGSVATVTTEPCS